MENVEESAKANGWVPEEDFRANPNNEGKKWRSAEEFMDRKSLFDKIDDQHRTIKNLQQGVTALQLHNSNIEKNTREKVLRELRAEKAQAVEEGDLKKVEEIRDQIEEVKAQPIVEAPKGTPEVPPEFKIWVDENKWYSSDQEMRDFADSYGVMLHKRGKTPDQILKEVSKKVKDMYPDKFRNPNKESAPPVEGSTSRKAGAGRAADPELSDMEEKIWKNLERARVPSHKDSKKLMTREEYVEQIKASR